MGKVYVMPDGSSISIPNNRDPIVLRDGSVVHVEAGCVYYTGLRNGCFESLGKYVTTLGYADLPEYANDKFHLYLEAEEFVLVVEPIKSNYEYLSNLSSDPDRFSDASTNFGRGIL